MAAAVTAAILEVDVTEAGLVVMVVGQAATAATLDAMDQEVTMPGEVDIIPMVTQATTLCIRALPTTHQVTE